MKKWIVLVLAISVLGGCGTKFVYHHIDWFVIEYLDDYVTLTNDQEALVSQRMDALIQWHQRRELEQYIDHLDRLIAIDNQAITLDQLQQHRNWLYQHYQRLLTQLAPDIFLLAQSLSEEQVDEFMIGVAKRHQKYADHYQQLSEKETRERYEERIKERIEQWLGALNKNQTALVHQWANTLEITTFDWMAFQSTLRQQLRVLLSNRNDEPHFHQQLQVLLFEPERYYSPVFKAKLNYNQHISDQFVLQVIHSATEKQIAHFKETVSDWRSIASDLHGGVQQDAASG